MRFIALTAVTMFFACATKPLRSEESTQHALNEVTYFMGAANAPFECGLQLVRRGEICMGSTFDSHLNSKAINVACPGHGFACEMIFDCHCEIIWRGSTPTVALVNGECATPGDAGAFFREFIATVEIDAGVFKSCTRREPMKLGDWPSDSED